MSAAPLALAVVVVAPLLGLLLSFNRFVSQRALVRNSWAQIDTELRRRYDLIPNLVETVKGYAAHERGVFTAVAEARAAATAATATTGDAAIQADAERPLVEGTRQLLALAEQYPALRASEHFLELQQQLSETEDRLAVARRFYNANVRDLNRRLEAFPSNLVGRWFGFHPATYFEVDEIVRTAPRGPHPPA